MRAIVLLLLLVAAPAAAEDRPLSSAIGPSAALLAGSTLDLASTLHALRTVPGAEEGNPILSHGGTAGLVVTKVALTAAIVYAITRISKQGHPKAAAVIGYVGGIAFAGIAFHNTQVGR